MPMASGHGEAEEQHRPFAGRGGRVAHGGLQIVAEQDAEAGARADQAGHGQARADVFGCCNVHLKKSL